MALAQRVQELNKFRSEFFGRLRRILADREDIRVVGDRFVFSSEVLFAPGSADLSAGQEPLLDKLVASVERFPGSQVRVEGHTDDTGSRNANLRLSRRRADSVARLMEIKLGRTEGEIATEGFGPDRPIGPNSTAEGRAKNRRIDVVVMPAP